MLNFNTPQNTRIAPSPTGKAHIGFVRTAYLNYLAASSSGGRFILRIDDTDKERSKPEYEADLIQTMEWLGLEYDEIHRQSERLGRHQELAFKIAGDVEGAVRLNPRELVSSWPDLITGNIEISGSQVEPIKNLVILREDKTPTYHWASCVDDADMGINLVIRGTDHMTNSGKHVHIYKELGIELPTFAHVGLIFHNGKKISKRDGYASMEFYKEKYAPEAVLNAVLKLGWSHPDPKFDKKYPLVDKQMAIELFREGNLKAAKSTLDVGKLDWLNKRYAAT
jgi:glutamyl-tRNA synthetase